MAGKKEAKLDLLDNFGAKVVTDQRSLPRAKKNFHYDMITISGIL